MGLISRFQKKKAAEPVAPKDVSQGSTPTDTPVAHTPANGSIHSQEQAQERPQTADGTTVALKELPTTWIAVFLGGIASIGGFMFGYESGQIGGFLAMSDFIDRFGKDGKFSPARQGTIVGLLCIGTLLGCLLSGYICDRIGRKLTISFSALFYMIGVLIEITSMRSWVQFAIGRLVGGVGIGALSTSVPMYQSESVPKKIRAATVSSYQLAITLGIWVAYMVNFGTETMSNSAQWRIPNGLSFAWALILAASMMILPESPRFAYRKGKVAEARHTMARLAGVDEYHPVIEEEIAEIEEKLQAERAGGDHPLSEIFTGPRMLYRTLLGMILQAGQQLTGANFFFYYGTIVFKSTGIQNSYVTSIILGSVNVAATVVCIIYVNRWSRRKALMGGAAWMFMCFMIYAFVGRFALDSANPMLTPAAGKVLIVFTCLFICAFAVTWGPLVWAVVGELYPARYRAPCMALATASNWLFNFLISFFTTFITDKINYFYGLVFGGCCFGLFWIVYFFMIETKGRSLEEIDTMYVLGVDPRTSGSWTPEQLGPEGIRGAITDKLNLAAGGKEIKKTEAAGSGLMVHDETRFPNNEKVVENAEASGSATTNV